MKLLSIDYGRRKVGLAVSNREGTIAFPLMVLVNSKSLISDLEDICRREKIEAVVLGQSMDTDQRPNPLMRDIERLRLRLIEVTGLAVYWEPEQFTSREARAAGVSHDKLDASAAALILQSFLDKQPLL